MRIFNNVNAYIMLFVIVFTTITFAQQSNNNAFLFDGESSQLYVKDNDLGNEAGFDFFNSFNQITVQAWIYLLGDSPADVEIPVVYREVQTGTTYGTTFSMYVKNNRGYFTVGESDPVVTPEFPSFRWTALTGTFDGSDLKIYLDGDLVEPYSTFEITTSYSINSESGLFVGNSNSGAFRGLIDEIRIFDIALGHNDINGSGGNGNPAEPFPSSLDEYLRGQWSFTEINSVDGLLHDLSTYQNHLTIDPIIQIFPSKHLPFFVVTSTLDHGDADLGDGKATSFNGQVTLRSAIEEANALAGYQIVYFYIPGSAPYIIQPGTALPNLTEQVYLDATLQNGYNGSPVIQINGTYGNLTITGGSSTVQGLSINNSVGFGLTLSSAGGNSIELNQIAGIRISSPDNTISNNEFSNSNIGVDISEGAGNSILSDNIILSNTVGLELNASNFALTQENTVSNNVSDGIIINGNGNTISNQIISDNGGVGVLITSGGNNSVLSANTISGNAGAGININTPDFVLNQENEIHGNLGYGVVVNGSGNNISNQKIYSNGASGVFVQSGNNNSILNNSIYDNTTLGIELAVGTNDSQQYPTLNIMYTWQDETAPPPPLKGGTAIQGTLNSTPDNYKIQFFANSSTSISREGKRFLGEKELTVDDFDITG
ncbi:MAG: hypothetical protein HKM87_05215, partial [Ignavibacteriaceae bacterium]|nr:hypothetical protein [Ignavibacteriaceae bacterium]